MNFRNAAGTALDPRINPNFSTLLMATTGTTSRYDSLQVSVNRADDPQSAVQIAYTFSNCIDDGSSPLGSISGGNTSSFTRIRICAIPSTRVLCYFNANSTLRVNGVWTPALQRQRIRGRMAAQRPSDAKHGPAVQPLHRRGHDRLGGQQQSRAQMMSPDARCRSDTPTQWFNPACYSFLRPGTLGNAGRDTISGPGLARGGLCRSPRTRRFRRSRKTSGCSSGWTRSTCSTIRNSGSRAIACLARLPSAPQPASTPA